jgi:hypothetical protein
LSGAGLNSGFGGKPLPVVLKRELGFLLLLWREGQNHLIAVDNATGRLVGCGRLEPALAQGFGPCGIPAHGMDFVYPHSQMRER